MNNFSKDEIIKLYLRVKALKNNLPTGSINERYVKEYSTIIDSFLPWFAGVSVSEFYIEETDLERKLISFNTLTGEQKFSSDRYIERALFLSKLDAFCEYIKIKFKDILNDV